ncbi:MAG: anti-sigma factor [Litorilinea sp.]
MTRDEVLAALPGYVLDALEPDEKHVVEDYLRKHPELSTRVRDLDAASAALAESTPMRAMPAGMKASVMDRVRADAQPDRPRLATHVKRSHAQQPAAPDTPNSGTPNSGTPNSGTLNTGTPPPSLGTPARPLPKPARQKESPLAGLRRWWAERRYAGYALGLAGALAVLLVVVVIQAQLIVQRNTASLAELQTQATSLQSEIGNLRTENQVLQAAVAEQRQQWATILDAEQEVLLAGTDDAPTAQAVFYAADDQVLVIAAGLAEVASDQTYQLWLIPAEGAPVSAGLLDAPREGTATFLAASPLARDGYTAVGISLEPAGGSASPTGPIVLLGEVG